MFSGMKRWFEKHNIEPQGFVIACAALICLSAFVVIGTLAVLSSFFG